MKCLLVKDHNSCDFLYLDEACAGLLSQYFSAKMQNEPILLRCKNSQWDVVTIGLTVGQIGKLLKGWHFEECAILPGWSANEEENLQQLLGVSICRMENFCGRGDEFVAVK